MRKIKKLSIVALFILAMLFSYTVTAFAANNPKLPFNENSVVALKTDTLKSVYDVVAPNTGLYKMDFTNLADNYEMKIIFRNSEGSQIFLKTPIDETTYAKEVTLIKDETYTLEFYYYGDTDRNINVSINLVSEAYQGTSFSTAITCAEGIEYKSFLIEDALETVFYKISLNSQGIVQFTGSGSATLFKVYNSSSKLISEIFCEDNTISSNIGLKNGTYYIGISKLYDYTDPSYSFNYRFTASNTCEIESNDTSACATAISLNTAYSGQIGYNASVTKDCGKADWYKFATTKGGFYRVSVSNIPTLTRANAKYSVINGDDESTISLAFSDGETSVYEFKAGSSTAYFGISGIRDTRIDYQITVVKYDPCVNGHTYDSGKITKEATCEATGVKTYTCTVCDNKKTETIAKLAHELDSGKITKEATCTATGVKSYTCYDCKKVIKTESIPKLEHDLDNGKVTKAATCSATGVKSYTCYSCKKVIKTEAISKLAHTSDGGVITKAATCTKTGVKTYTCTVCKAVIKTETVKMAAHSYNRVITKATFSKNGTSKDTCKVCGKKVTTTIYKAVASLSTSQFTYNGKEQKPTVTVKDSKGNVLTTSSYSLKYSNSKSSAFGTYTVTVTLKGNYSGTKQLTYKIVPKKPGNVDVSSPEKKTVKIKISSISGVTGYEIYSSKSASGTFTKLGTTTSTQFTKSGLTSGKKYYFKVRAYYKDKSGNTVYGNWSDVIAIKIK